MHWVYGIRCQQNIKIKLLDWVYWDSVSAEHIALGLRDSVSAEHTNKIIALGLRDSVSAEHIALTGFTGFGVGRT